jgi:hypothetical protein
MPAWFDIAATTCVARRATDLDGLKSADALVRSLVEREIERGVPSNNIVIAASARAARSRLRGAAPREAAAGAIALSTYLARNVTIEAQSHARQPRPARVRGRTARSTASSPSHAGASCATVSSSSAAPSNTTSIRWTTRCASRNCRRSAAGSRP